MKTILCGAYDQHFPEMASSSGPNSSLSSTMLSINTKGLMMKTSVGVLIMKYNRECLKEGCYK